MIRKNEKLYYKADDGSYRELGDIRELSREVGRHRQWIYELGRRGIIKAVTHKGNIYLYDIEECREIIEGLARNK